MTEQPTTVASPAVSRQLPKRTIERLRAARLAGRSFRGIEQTMARTIKVTPGNGTAAMRLCRIAGIA